MSTLDGLVVRRTTAAQQVADGLSERILAGAFKPGERLREAAIAAELGIARNTVREAVRILELGGLVRFEVNRGAVVISPTPDAVAELYNARERLETAAVARPLTKEQLAIIETAFGNLVTTVMSHDQAQIVAADLGLHTAIVSTLSSSRISKFHAELTRELRFYLMALSAHDREFEKPHEVVAEHEPLMAAIRAGDHERAMQEVSHHIAVNVDRVQKVLAARNGNR
jgi:DNA-binding GntR family transcriptional regulator